MYAKFGLFFAAGNRKQLVWFFAQSITILLLVTAMHRSLFTYWFTKVKGIKVVYTLIQRGYCALPFSRNTALHLLAIFTLVIAICYSDFNGIAAGSDCLHDYCGSHDTFKDRLTRMHIHTHERELKADNNDLGTVKKLTALVIGIAYCLSYIHREIFMIWIRAFNIPHT